MWVSSLLWYIQNYEIDEFQLKEPGVYTYKRYRDNRTTNKAFRIEDFACALTWQG